MPLTRDDYIFFWKTNEVHGWASQWAPSPFTVKVNIKQTNTSDAPSSDTDSESITFTSAEHWMMFQKALLFNDITIAREILSITTINSGSMAQIKALGRQVSNFNNEIWESNRMRIVVEGNLHKFRQNGEIRKKLLETGDKVLVEASPGDRIWGVGFGEKRALSEKQSWGLNLLGKALEETRRILREEEEAEVRAKAGEATME